MKGKYILLLAILFPLLYSCQKDESNIINNATKGLIGHYRCVSIQWQGQPIDISGKGNATNDIINGFQELSNANAALEKGAYVDSPKEINDLTLITLCVPMQSLIYNKEHGSYDLINQSGFYAYLYLYYGVDEKGALFFKKTERLKDEDDYYKEDEYEVKYYDMKYTGDAEILSMANGTLSVKMKACYFDWLQNKIERDDIILKFVLCD